MINIKSDSKPVIEKLYSLLQTSILIEDMSFTKLSKKDIEHEDFKLYFTPSLDLCRYYYRITNLVV